MKAVVLLAATLSACGPAPAAVVAPRARSEALVTPAQPPAPTGPATASPSSPSSAPATPLPEDLADGLLAHLTKRTILMRRGKVRFSEDGDIAAGAAPPERLATPVELPVLAEHPARVRVLLETRGVLRLLVFVDRADLQRVPVAEVGLALAPGAPARPDAGVRVAAGLRLDPRARSGGMRQVAATLDEVAFEGWIPESALGEVFEPRPLPARASGGRVREGAVVTATPGGAVMARFRAAEPGQSPGFSTDVEPEPGAPPGYQRIRYATRFVEIRGMVRAADYRLPRPDDLGGIGTIGHGAGAGGRSPLPFLGMLADGALLFERGRTTPVGVALRSLAVMGTGQPGGEGFLDIEIQAWPFHFLQARVRAADVRPPDVEQDRGY